MNSKVTDKKSRAQIKFLLDLWDLRFSKLLEGECGSYRNYEQLLLRNHKRLSDKAVRILNEIKTDEAKHIRLADQLLALVRKKQIEETPVSRRTYG